MDEIQQHYCATDAAPTAAGALILSLSEREPDR
jgi:hypothetical protein